MPLANLVAVVPGWIEAARLRRAALLDETSGRCHVLTHLEPPARNHR